MCFAVISLLQFVFLIIGVLALFSGKLPELVVGKGFKVEGGAVRAIGLLMTAPLVGGICTSLIDFISGGTVSSSTDMFTFTGILLLLIVSVITIIWMRVIRKPSKLETPSSTEK